MRIATISDVHGNRHALQAVFADINGQGVDQLFCLVDLVGYGPYGKEVIELIRQRRICRDGR
jgi:predicted phosphodiesterase